MRCGCFLRCYRTTCTISGAIRTSCLVSTLTATLVLWWSRRCQRVRVSRMPMEAAFILFSPIMDTRTMKACHHPRDSGGNSPIQTWVVTSHWRTFYIPRRTKGLMVKCSTLARTILARRWRVLQIWVRVLRKASILHTWTRRRKSSNRSKASRENTVKAMETVSSRRKRPSPHCPIWPRGNSRAISKVNSSRGNLQVGPWLFSSATIFFFFYRFIDKLQ